MEGVHDMFTSVPEWVQDWYDDEYYRTTNFRNPQGPAAAAYKTRLHEYGGGSFSGSAGGRVVRGNRWSMAGGAGWDRNTLGAPLWFRGQRDPLSAAGFRCAGDGAAALPAGPRVYRGMTWHQVGEP